MLNFDSLRPTIMVVTATFEGTIDVDSVFPLLEITRLPHETETIGKKRKMPLCTIPGAILSARYREVCRGIVRLSFFRNNIIVDMSNGVKNVSIKLSSRGMHICGANSLQAAKEASEMLLQQVLYIQWIVDWLNEDSERKEAVFDFLLESTKGPVVLEQGSLKRLTRIPDMQHDNVVLSYLLGLAREYPYYDDLVTQLQWIKGLDKITDGVKLDSYTTVMVNYNYELGYEINRFALRTHIDGVNGFSARYENEVEHSVTITLPYSDKKAHTFIVYRTGRVTQSGPDIDRIRQAYDLFATMIEQIRPYIVKKASNT